VNQASEPAVHQGMKPAGRHLSLAAAALAVLPALAAAPAWKLVPAPSPGRGVFNALLASVTQISNKDSWAVGTDNGHPLIEHWNGSRWSAATVPKGGITVVPQYGVGGYRVDFAAAHPDDAGRMVLAIEADEASYRGSGSVRDRDRLRGEHLQRLGWSFHRLWSTNWFSDPQAEVTKLRAAYDRAVAAAEPEAAGQEAAGPPDAESPDAETQAPGQAVVPWAHEPG
jgi:very-short-patch-repair endonuclease